MVDSVMQFLAKVVRQRTIPPAVENVPCSRWRAGMVSKTPSRPDPPLSFIYPTSWYQEVWYLSEHDSGTSTKSIPLISC